jgi:hypothetical protein
MTASKDENLTMSRINRQEQAVARKKSAADVIRSLTTQCCKCAVPGSKRRLIQLDDGPTCSSCLPDGLTLGHALREEKVNKALYEPNPDAPQPESFGDWA